MPTLPAAAEQLVDQARQLAAKVNPGPKQATRSLPIRSSVEEVQRLWSTHRAEVLDGIPARTAELRVGPEQSGSWGTTFTLELELDAPLPDIATQALAGKAVRRLKAIAETGELPTTQDNPAYRGEAVA